HRKVHFGREHDVVPGGILLQRSPDDLFRAADAVDVGGVPEGDAELDSLLEERLGLLIAQRPLAEATRCVAEAHATERDTTDLEARVTQTAVLHDQFLSSRVAMGFGRGTSLSAPYHD